MLYTYITYVGQLHGPLKALNLLQLLMFKQVHFKSRTWW